MANPTREVLELDANERRRVIELLGRMKRLEDSMSRDVMPSGSNSKDTRAAAEPVERPGVQDSPNDDQQGNA